MREKTGGRGVPASSPLAGDLAPRTAAKELGLGLRELELAVQLDEVRTVPAAPGEPRRVPREELLRIKGAPDFPGGLRERLRVMGASEASELLDISPARFARLARAGCLGPVSLYVNRYRTVVWLYRADELRDFAENSAPLLAGRLPVGMRAALQAGTDQRAEKWRTRRVQQLTRQAGTPWERAAARAGVLSEDTLAEAVPHPVERRMLRQLRPSLLRVRSESVATRGLLEKLCLASGEEEVRRHRLMLEADLEAARVAELLSTDSFAAGPAFGGQGRSEDRAQTRAFLPHPGQGRPHPGTPRPLTPEPAAPVPRRRWSLLRRRRPRPAAQPAH